MEQNRAIGLPGWLQRSLQTLEGGPDVWLVGGAVRDWLLQRGGHDYDLVTSGSGRKIGRALADSLGAAYYTLDQARDTGRVVYRDEAGQVWDLDVASLRGRDLEEDLRERDFTINALAVHVSGSQKYVDVTGGRQDLLDRVLRPCSLHSLTNDPVRILRAVRIAVELGFRMDPALPAQIRENVHLILNISSERIRDELFKIFSLNEPARALRVMNQLGILDAVAAVLLEPGGSAASRALDINFHQIDIHASIVSMIRSLKPDRVNADMGSAVVFNGLRPFRRQLAEYVGSEITPGRSRYALMTFHLLVEELLYSCAKKDDGWPQYFIERLEQASRALRLSNAEIAFLSRLSDPGVIPAPESDVRLSLLRCYRQIRDALPAGILVELGRELLDRSPAGQARWPETVTTASKCFNMYFEHADQLDPEHFLDGSDVLELLNMRPGPELGRLLIMLEEAQVLGLIESKEEARTFLIENEGKAVPIEKTDRYLEHRRLGVS